MYPARFDRLPRKLEAKEMVNPMNTTAARKPGKLTPAAAARNYIAKKSASRSVDNVIVDEVIASLANAHENRRARQVTEWERMGGRQLHYTV